MESVRLFCYLQHCYHISHTGELILGFHEKRWYYICHIRTNVVSNRKAVAYALHFMTTASVPQIPNKRAHESITNKIRSLFVRHNSLQIEEINGPSGHLLVNAKTNHWAWQGASFIQLSNHIALIIWLKPIITGST